MWYGRCIETGQELVTGSCLEGREEGVVPVAVSLYTGNVMCDAVGILTADLSRESCIIP
jgi:hypothetical protein